MHLLITNDDGINAPGIRHLFQAVKNRENTLTTVVAPAHERSASGLSITLRDPLKMTTISDWGEPSIFSVTGTPADCVKLSLFTQAPPHLVLSGINRGSNDGRNVLYSGTIGGVIEAALRGIPGIAFSCFDLENPDYAQAAAYIPSIIDFVLEHPLPKGTILNVNFPSHIVTPQYKGFRMARQGKGCWIESPFIDPKEGHFWLGGRLHIDEKDHEEGDSYLLSQGYVTAVPIHVGELTDLEHFQEKKDYFKTIAEDGT